MISLKNMTRIFIGLAVMLALVIYTIRYYVSESMLKPERFLIENNFEQFKRGFSPLDNRIINAKAIDIYGEDSIRLSAYYIPGLHNKTNKTIIGLHDLGSCKEHLYTMARWAQERGISTLIFDLRAHGKSEGEHFTYGKKETTDLIKIVDWIKQTKPSSNIGLWGFSSGAGIAIQSMAKDDRISFAILENTYLKNQDLALSKQEYVPKFISKLAFQRVKSIINSDDKNDPVELANQVKQNVLMIHGEKNQFLSLRDSKELFEALRSKNKNYLTQLRLDTSCNNLDYKNVNYNKNSLVKYFLAYNIFVFLLSFSY